MTAGYWDSIKDDLESGTVDENDIYFRIYFGGVEPEIRKQVWPYLLGHYKSWTLKQAEVRELDAKTQTVYENKLSDWMAIEAIIRQKDREVTAANIAKISNSNHLSLIHQSSSQYLSNEVFESMDDGAPSMSSRTVSADKISTITEATENSTSNSEKSRGKLASTQSDTGPPSSIVTKVAPAAVAVHHTTDDSVPNDEEENGKKKPGLTSRLTKSTLRARGTEIFSKIGIVGQIVLHLLY